MEKKEKKKNNSLIKKKKSVKREKYRLFGWKSAREIVAKGCCPLGLRASPRLMIREPSLTPKFRSAGR